VAVCAGQHVAEQSSPGEESVGAGRVVSWEAVQYFPPRSDSPGSARRFVADALRAGLGPVAGPPIIADAQLLITELMTNALNARSTSLEVQMSLERDVVRISVRDDAPGGPSPRVAAITDEHGRGLGIVAALGQAWGVEYRGGGKRVWVDLQVDAAR